MLASISFTVVYLVCFSSLSLSVSICTTAYLERVCVCVCVCVYVCVRVCVSPLTIFRASTARSTLPLGAPPASRALALSAAAPGAQCVTPEPQTLNAKRSTRCATWTTWTAFRIPSRASATTNVISLRVASPLAAAAAQPLHSLRTLAATCSFSLAPEMNSACAQACPRSRSPGHVYFYSFTGKRNSRRQPVHP